MAFTWAMALLVAGLVAVVIGISSSKKKSRMTFVWLGVIGGAIGLLALGNFVPQLAGLNGAISFGAGGTTAGTGGTLAITTYQPSASLSTKDKYSSTVVSGTSYIKVGENPASTASSATPSVNKGDRITYWLLNGTHAAGTGLYYTAPETKVAGDGVTYFVANAWVAPKTTSVGLYDLVGKKSVTAPTGTAISGTANISFGANAQANVELTYQGTAKKSALPFGGTMVIEYNSSISSVTCTGADLLSSNPYQLTYTPSTTQHTFRTWGIAPTIDDGTGAVRVIDCQIQNGAKASATDTVFFQFYPANWYVSQDGRILLDVEKQADASTTRTTDLTLPNATMQWALT